MQVKYVEYKGKKVLFIDYSGIRNQGDMLTVLNEAADYYRKSNVRVACVSNMENSFMGLNYMNEFKKLTMELFGAKAGKTALYGLTEMQNILIKGYNNKIAKGAGVKRFKSKLEAFDYVIS